MESSQPTAPCRLFVYLATAAPIAVVLRRGPSQWARLSLWHTDLDTFEHGQWVASRIYERRGDLSADGQWFIYFARKSGPSPARAEAPRADTWVAISRPPWFTALALWWVGGTYCSGGMFPRPGQVWLGWLNPPDQGHLPPWLTLTRDLPHSVVAQDWTERTVHTNRLLRAGWRMAAAPPIETWERRHPTAPWTLLLAERGWDPRAHGGPHVVEYAVQLEPERDLVPLPGVTWADWDQAGRLVFARAGALWHWAGPGDERVIHDFTAQRPDPQPAPPSAQHW